MSNNLFQIRPTKEFIKEFPEREYFDIDEYIEAGLVVKGGITIINGGRNIGKTTGTLIKGLRKCNSEHQLFFVRNTEKEIRSFQKTFNSEFSTEFYMSQTEIGRVERIELLNKKTKKIEVEYRKKDVIGFVAALNGVDGGRSANFKYIKYVYSDEYNQVGNGLNAEKFLTLGTSVLRTKDDVYTVLIGNRDDATTDLMVELSIEIAIPDDRKGDYVQEILPDDEHFSKMAYFVDVLDTRFTNNNKPTIGKAIGRKTDVMGEYYDGGYKSYENADCRKLPANVLEKIEWKFSHSYEEDITIIFGELNGVVVAHGNKDGRYTPKIRFASTEFCAANRGYLPLKHNMEYVYNYISRAMKNKTILFTSIQAKEEARDILNTLALELEDDMNFEL